MEYSRVSFKILKFVYFYIINKDKNSNYYLQFIKEKVIGNIFIEYKMNI